MKSIKYTVRVIYCMKMETLLMIIGFHNLIMYNIQNEVLNLYTKLYNEYKAIPRIDDEDSIAFNEIKHLGNWKKLYSDYPWNYLGYVFMFLANAINNAYEDTQVEFSF